MEETYREHVYELQLHAEEPPIRSPAVEKQRDEILIRPCLQRESRFLHDSLNAKERAHDHDRQDERRDDLWGSPS